MAKKFTYEPPDVIQYQYARVDFLGEEVPWERFDTEQYLEEDFGVDLDQMEADITYGIQELKDAGIEFEGNPWRKYYRWDTDIDSEEIYMLSWTVYIDDNIGEIKYEIESGWWSYETENIGIHAETTKELIKKMQTEYPGIKINPSPTHLYHYDIQGIAKDIVQDMVDRYGVEQDELDDPDTFDELWNVADYETDDYLQSFLTRDVDLTPFEEEEMAEQVLDEVYAIIEDETFIRRLF